MAPITPPPAESLGAGRHHHQGHLLDCSVAGVAAAGGAPGVGETAAGAGSGVTAGVEANAGVGASAVTSGDQNEWTASTTSFKKPSTWSRLPVTSPTPITPPKAALTTMIQTGVPFGSFSQCRITTRALPHPRSTLRPRLGSLRQLARGSRVPGECCFVLTTASSERAPARHTLTLSRTIRSLSRSPPCLFPPLRTPIRSNIIPHRAAGKP